MQIGFDSFISIIIFILGFTIAGVGWWVNQMWDMLKAQQALLGLIQIELAKNYVPRMELQETFKALHFKLDEIPKEMRAIVQDSVRQNRYENRNEK